MRSLDAASAAVGESCWAAALHSENQCAETEEAVGSGRIPLVFVSEKRATSNRFKRLLAGLHEQEKLLAIAVDEAHLIYWWGKDFRAEYRNLGTLRDCVKGVPFLALTATAAPHVADDIASQLRLHEPLRARGSIYREHLHLARELRPSSAAGTQARVIELLRKRGTPALVYVNRVDDAESLLEGLGDALKDECYAVETYHGPGVSGTKKQSDAERKRVFADFMDDTAGVVVATCAFGLGINKVGIRQVIHVGAPRGFVDGYYQEVSRGGRGGVPACCTILTSSGDITGNERTHDLSAAADQFRGPSSEIARVLLFGRDGSACG